MQFPSKYKVLSIEIVSEQGFSLVPIRFEDRIPIMKWRNEQIYHLRQKEPLTVEGQDKYYREYVASLFEQDAPENLLFSYLKDGVCIGYGGLVHINWTDRNAEISFIIDTELENSEFHQHWGRYLKLLAKIAFDGLHLHKIYTYAFDIRPKLFPAVEAAGFEREAILKEHFLFNGNYYDVVYHARISTRCSMRDAVASDAELTFSWANDPETRANSFSSGSIDFGEHLQWWNEKMESPSAKYFIGELGTQVLGLVRFDVKEDFSVIGITVAPEVRGLGYAKIMLEVACKRYFSLFSKPVWAWIKEENHASIKAFERTGFNKIGEELIGNFLAYKYQREK
jgi:RimJ/RimL family protein N-acetyltransferase